MRIIIPEHLEGKRLDKALALLLPDASLRHRRRLVETGAARLNEAKARPGIKVRAGQVLELVDQEQVPPAAGVELLHREGEYAAVVKPVGVHSAAIRGGGASVESALPQLFPGEAPLLLNRLDQDTSGFVLVAFGDIAEARFRDMEVSGQVRKEYLAVVAGEFDSQTVVRNSLDMVDRKLVRVLDDLDPDPARHTHVEPILYDENSEATQVRVIIARGARHQIRAHLASHGCPIVGDTLYGDESGNSDGRLFLHHRSISFSGFSAELEPDWKV